MEATDTTALAEDILARLTQAWASQDADVFADLFDPEASCVLPGLSITGRERIREFASNAFKGPWKGTRLDVTMTDARRLGGDCVLFRTAWACSQRTLCSHTGG